MVSTRPLSAALRLDRSSSCTHSARLRPGLVAGPVQSASGAYPAPPGFMFRGLEAHRADLERFLLKRCRDASEVDDIVQEAFMRAARYRKTLDSDLSLRPWLVRIASNVLANRVSKELRRLERQTADDDLEMIVGREREPGEDLGEEEVWVDGQCRAKSRVLGAMREALDCLGRSERRLLLAYYRDRAEARRLAAQLGWSAEVLKVRLFRSRRRLRSELLRTLQLNVAGLGDGAGGAGSRAERGGRLSRHGSRAGRAAAVAASVTLLVLALASIRALLPHAAAGPYAAPETRGESAGPVRADAARQPSSLPVDESSTSSELERVDVQSVTHSKQREALAALDALLAARADAALSPSVPELEAALQHARALLGSGNARERLMARLSLDRDLGRLARDEGLPGSLQSEMLLERAGVLSQLQLDDEAFECALLALERAVDADVRDASLLVAASAARRRHDAATAVELYGRWLVSSAASEVTVLRDSTRLYQGSCALEAGFEEEGRRLLTLVADGAQLPRTRIDACDRLALERLEQADAEGAVQWIRHALRSVAQEAAALTPDGAATRRALHRMRALDEVRHEFAERARAEKLSLTRTFRLRDE